MLPPAPVIRTQRPATAKLLKLSLWNGLRSGKSAPKSASKGRFMSRCLNQYRRVDTISPNQRSPDGWIYLCSTRRRVFVRLVGLVSFVGLVFGLVANQCLQFRDPRLQFFNGLFLVTDLLRF